MSRISTSIEFRGSPYDRDQATGTMTTRMKRASLSCGNQSFSKVFRDEEPPKNKNGELPGDEERNVLELVKGSLQVPGVGEGLPKIVLLAISTLRHDGINFHFLLEILPNLLTLFKMLPANTHLVSEAVEKLKSASLVSLIHTLDNSKVIMIHPQIQKAVRHLFPQDWKQVISTSLENLGIIDLGHDDLQQVLKMWEVVENDPTLFTKHAHVANKIFNGIWNNSQFPNLLPFANKHRTNLHLHFDQGSEIILWGDLLLGEALMMNSQFDEAFTLINAILGQVHHQTSRNPDRFLALKAECLWVKSCLLGYLGKVAEGIQIGEEALPLFITFYGGGHRNTIQMKDSLSSLLSEAKEWPRALHLRKQVLEWRLKVKGQTHPDTLKGRLDLAILHNKNGGQDEAVREFAIVLDLIKELKKTSVTLEIRTLLAEALLEVGEYGMAEGQFTLLVHDTSLIFGQTQQLFTHQYNHALCLYNLEDFEGARYELLEVLDFEVKVYGVNHQIPQVTRGLLEDIDAKLKEEKEKPSCFPKLPVKHCSLT